MVIKEVVTKYPHTVRIFSKHGLPCVGCHVAEYETVAQGAAAHSIQVDALLRDLNAVVTSGLQDNDHQHDEETPKQAARNIKHVIAVMSGKGGVGKSLVTALLAISLKRKGHSVGILDADITGPSIPRMFGLSERPRGREGVIIPVKTTLGIKVMSMNLLLDNEEDAVIWRGPVISGVIGQFYNDVEWENLDYLIVDLPPGTSDAPLTVLQQLPVDGIVLVSTPQGLATMVVQKAVQLAKAMKTTVIGVVENMSYFVSPDTGKQYELFGPSKGWELALAAGAPLLGNLPIDPRVTELADAGRIEEYESEAYAIMAGNFAEQIGLTVRS